MDSLNAQDTELSNKPLKKFKALKIITAVLYAIATLLAVWLMVDILSQPKNIGTAFAVGVWLGVDIPALAVPLIVSLISLIVSIVKKSRSECSVGSVVYFAVFTVLPIVTFLLCVMIFKIILN